MLKLVFTFVLALTMCGCISTSRESYERKYGVENGQPVDVTTVRQGQDKTKVDIPPILSAAASAAGGGGIDWASILAGVGAAATTVTTGYLAMKKNEQIKQSKKG